MAQPSAAILRAPGTNCDQETAFAFELSGARSERVHVGRLLEQPALLDDFQILCLPGGFSYGDDLGAGRILGTQIRHHLTEQLDRFRSQGKLILGICNGFQILMKSGILVPFEIDRAPAATLTWNDSGKFEDRWVHLAASGSQCVFFAGIEKMYLPVAHAEGKFVPRDAETLNMLQAGGQLALRYAAEPNDHKAARAEERIAYPLNPNGSVANVAALCDESGRVCGMMPHPERHIHPTQHPRWTREGGAAEGDGLRVFQNAVRYFS